MLRTMTAKQLLEWSEFARLEPFGEDREDARFGSIVQVIANSNRDPKKRKTPWALHECTIAGGDVPLPIEVAAQKPPTAWEKLKEMAREWVEAAPGKKEGK